MPKLILLFLFIVSFSLLTLIELIVLKLLGFDIVAHLEISYQSGKNVRFIFEAFGVIAFIVGQPMVLTWLLVWLSNNVNSELLKDLAVATIELFRQQIKVETVFMYRAANRVLETNPKRLRLLKHSESQAKLFGLKMTTSNNDQIPNQTEMIDAIRRSGYLIESQISEMLSNAGFFVESNQVIKDPLTGKSREIDLLAEYYSYQEGRQRTAANVKFTFEVKNNLYPLVLMTELKSTPNIEIWESLREVITQAESTEHSIEDGFYGNLIGDKTNGIFTQYCTFKRKKDSKESELMAFHPDEFHDGLVKIVQHCDEQAAFWQDKESDGFFRDFLYLPVVVLGGELYELPIDVTPKLRQVQTSRLLYNYHWGDEPRCAVIYIVTMEGFRSFINNIIEVERRIEDQMAQKNKAAQKASPNTPNNGAPSIDKKQLWSLHCFCRKEIGHLSA